MSPQLPPPRAELVICRVGIEALLDVLGPKKGERFLKCMADRLETEERLSEVIRIRASCEDGAVKQARQEAMMWFRQMLPTFMARL